MSSDFDGDLQLPGRDVIVIFAVIFEGSLAPLSLLLGWWLGHNPLAHFTWDAADALRGAALALPPAALFLLMLRRPPGPLVRIKEFCEQEFVPLLAGSSWSDIALIAVSAGVGEEMLFRGVLQSSLCGWLGDAWGLALISILFGLMHPISLPYVGVAMVVGLYLGGLFLLSGNLLSVMAAHAVYDFLLLAYLLKFRPGQDPEPGSGIGEVDPSQNIDD